VAQERHEDIGERRGTQARTPELGKSILMGCCDFASPEPAPLTEERIVFSLASFRGSTSPLLQLLYTRQRTRIEPVEFVFVGSIA
jgi:hypothetical protein